MKTARERLDDLMKDDMGAAESGLDMSLTAKKKDIKKDAAPTAPPAPAAGKVTMDPVKGAAAQTSMMNAFGSGVSKSTMKKAEELKRNIDRVQKSLDKLRKDTVMQGKVLNEMYVLPAKEKEAGKAFSEEQNVNDKTPQNVGAKKNPPVEKTGFGKSVDDFMKSYVSWHPGIKNS